MQLSVIIPAFNEADNLPGVVAETQTTLENMNIPFEIIIVDDDSTDTTGAVGSELGKRYPEVRLVGRKRNGGSGAAIRTGIEQANGEFITYIPADGQFDTRELVNFLQLIERADLVIGVRRERSDYTWFRRLSSRSFIILTNLLFGCQFRDFVWVHMWRRATIAAMPLRSSGVFLCAEIIIRARRAGCRIRETASAYRPRSSGTATGGRLSTIGKTILEMIRFRLTPGTGAAALEE